MRPCPGCGTQSADTARFCADCGAGLVGAVAEPEHRKTVTLLFADVCGSTPLGERLDPESLRRVLIRFFETARTIIEGHGGTVEKFVGDAVMAVFGVPVVHEDDALRACRAALELMQALESLNIGLVREYDAALEIRIGVNTGDVVTGTDWLATGDAVNVAARLEQLAPPGAIYLGELTAHLAGSAVTVEELESVVLKGKSRPARIYRLLAASLAERPIRATPMVGRKRQLEMLRGASAQSVEDRSCVMFTVLGAAGVGKSRLIAEFNNGSDANIVRGRCLPYGSGVGLWPAVELVQQLQTGPAAAEVATLLATDLGVAAAISALLGGSATMTGSIEIAWAVRRLLESAAAAGPVVVLLDDLHWAEESLFQLVEHIVTVSRGLPILLVAMARPELLQRRRGWGGNSLNSSNVLLEPLGPEDTAALVDLLATSLDTVNRAKVSAAAAGNPLFAEEMVMLLESSDAGEVRVPPTIQALLAARLDQLEPDEIRALECGAVEGESFHRGAVEALMRSGTDASRQFDKLVGMDMLRPDRSTLGRPDAYRFRHALLRDAAYDRLPKSARADLHERFARWLDTQPSEVAELDSLVGYHLEQAYECRTSLGPADEAGSTLRLEAARRLELAGRHQMARFDLGGAIDLLDRSSALTGSRTPDVSLELGIAAALMICGRPREAVTRAAAAATAAAAAGNRIGAIQANLGRALFTAHTEGSDGLEQLQRILDTALPEFEAAGDDAALAWAWRAATEVAHGASRLADALMTATKCRYHAQLSNAPFLSTHTAYIASAIAWGPTPIPEALNMLDELRTSPAVIEPWIDTQRTDLLGLAGRIDEARALSDEVLHAYRDRGMTLTVAVFGQTKWLIEMAAGDLEAAVAVAEASCTELDRMGERAWMSTNASQLAESLYELGRDQQSLQRAEQALEIADSSDTVTQAQARMVRALVLARRGDVAGARRDIDDSLRVIDGMQNPQFEGAIALNAGTGFAALGDLESARQQLQRALDLFIIKGSTVYAGRAAQALAVVQSSIEAAGDS